MASTHSLLARLFRGAADDVPDSRLLGDALTRRDPAAFEALVSRHGPTVWAVCRRHLRNPADAEDAFQATFLVLLRKGRSLSGMTSVGGWLYQVAFRTALKARTAAARRSRREAVVARPEASVESEFNDELDAVHEELTRLPDIYRLAVLMCDLEGMPRKDAAERLGWKEGTLSGRLNRGRKLLADRLRTRGVVPLAVAVGASVLPAKLAAETVESGLCELGFEGMFRAAPASVAALTRGVLHDMATKYALKVCATLALLAGVLGVLGMGFSTGTGEPAARAAPVPKAVVNPADLTHERVFLVEHRKIQQELRLSPEARVAILDGLAQLHEEETDFYTNERSRGVIPPKDYHALQCDIVAKNLTAGEFRRLKQVELQLCGPFAFNSPAVAKELGLAAKQKETVEATLLAMYRKVGGKGAMQQAVIPFWNEAELPDVWTKASDTIFDQLNADQRKKWDELIGAKVSFSTVKHLRTFGQVAGQFAPSFHEPAVPVPTGVDPVLPPPAQPQPLPPAQPPAPPPLQPERGPVPPLPQAPGIPPPADLPQVGPGPGTLPPTVPPPPPPKR